MQVSNTKAGIQDAVRRTFHPTQAITVIKAPGLFMAIGKADAHVELPAFPIYSGPATNFWDLPFPEVVSEEPLAAWQEAQLWAQYYGQQAAGGPAAFGTTFK